MPWKRYPLILIEKFVSVSQAMQLKEFHDVSFNFLCKARVVNLLGDGGMIKIWELLNPLLKEVGLRPEDYPNF